MSEYGKNELIFLHYKKGVASVKDRQVALYSLSPIPFHEFIK